MSLRLRVCWERSAETLGGALLLLLVFEMIGAARVQRGLFVQPHLSSSQQMCCLFLLAFSNAVSETQPWYQRSSWKTSAYVTTAILANRKMSASSEDLDTIVWLGHHLTKQTLFVHLTGYQSGELIHLVHSKVSFCPNNYGTRDF